ncbi:DUF692 family protein [Legionella pneumophila]|nr:DUF692 family protein [Legionella pneumophila]
MTIISNNIDRVQNYLKRTLLIENPSSYLEYQTSSYSEPDFLAEIIKRTEARLLLDINNIYVSCSNNKRILTNISKESRMKQYKKFIWRAIPLSIRTIRISCG